MNTHGTVSSRFRDLRLIAGLIAVAVVGTVAVGIGQALAGSSTDAPTVSCPDVASQLPEVPEAAAGDVADELAALENQITAANDRLDTSQGQGGPNFIDNAILGPLSDKRFATLERIEIAIGRHGDRPSGLTALADCALNGDGGGDQGDDGGDAGGDAGDAGDGADNGDAGGGDAGDNGGGGNGDGDNGDGDNGDGAGEAPPAAGAPTVSCPDVASQLPEVPEAAAGDVADELAALENQITAANDRLDTSQGQGGPNFIDNAILGPLSDKRFATLERIEIAIGRHGDRPSGLTALADCALN